MNIKIIDEKEQFAQCETFEITHLLWGTKAIPKTYGKIACWKEHGFLVEMTCEEADPLRTYIKMNDPVSQDSGMEAFLGFWSEQIHYASYSPVDVPEPDFHRPEFFETGELQ